MSDTTPYTSTDEVSAAAGTEAHPTHHAATNPDKPAYIMANSGKVITYRELEERSNQIAQLFLALGLKTGDAIALFMENTPEFLQIAWAAQRSGLYFTAISSRLTASEIEYIVKDANAKILFASQGLAQVAQQVPALCGDIHFVSVGGEIQGYQNFDALVQPQPTAPIPKQIAGTDMLYSSGTTGKPKGVRRPLPDTPFDAPDAVAGLMMLLYGASPDMIYLTPAPLYHAAPLRFTMAIQRLGGTTIIMEHFDPEQCLQVIEKHKITHSQFVPTMFVRMLKMPQEARDKYDVSSIQVAIHAAAPCPVEIKKQMIKWWGNVIYEYYAGTEGNGFCAISSEEWLEHVGSVGRAITGILHICDENGKELPVGEEGVIFFENENQFSYHNDPQKTKESRHPSQAQWSTLGDIGKLDDEGYLYLTDRKAFMIISGGVNIYPQEAENVIINHDKVADVAVIGVPNEDFGEEVKAVVQPINWADANDALAEDVIAFCKQHLSPVKCPKSVDFEKELPRHATGKLYKRLLRDRYWGKKDSKII